MIGYKGNYFRYISDKEKHYYNFFYTDIIFKNPLSLSKEKNKSLSTIHLGIGYLHNSFNNNNTICLNTGFINEIISLSSSIVDGCTGACPSEGASIINELLI